MKSKTFALMLMSFLISDVSIARNVDYVKQRKGPNGYDEVKDYHNGDYHKLKCIDPGSNACEWPNGTPLVAIDEQQVEDDIIDEIMLGNLNGNVVITGGSYSWDAVDITDYSFTIIEEED